MPMTRERRLAILRKLPGAVGDARQREIERKETEAMEREGGPAGLSLAQYRNTEKGAREAYKWSLARGKDGRADFGGRRRTRRGRKHRSTRRR